MGISDYIEKLRTRPERERKRIVVIATAVSFAVIFVIWLVSFSEMNREVSDEPASVPLTDQLEGMRSDMERDKQSIQDMMQDLPMQSDMNEVPGGNLLPSDEMENSNQNMDNNQNGQLEIPSLP